jgi:TRAP transporter 4TM/12TM fusion protein
MIQKESWTRMRILLTLTALVFAGFQMLSSQKLLMSTIPYLSLHAAFCFLLTILSSINGSKSRVFTAWNWLLAAICLVSFAYILVYWKDIQVRAYFNSPMDLIVGVIIILLSLELTRQAFGLFLPILSLAIVGYGFLGSHLPEPFRSQSMPLDQTISNLSVSFEGGVYAFLHISANFLFLFILFGGVLNATGAINFFVSLGKIVMSKVRGGAAMMAVVASAGVGSVTGSAAANVAVTGSFTIPLMKKSGFRPEEAGGIEAAASNGGQILPPVMGMTAFAMAGLAGIPYILIMKMALLPAFLYFLTIGLYVFLLAGKRGMHKLQVSDAGEKVDLKELALSSVNFIVPLGAVIVLLLMGYSVNYVGFWAILVTIFVSLLRKKTRPSLEAFVDGLVAGVKQAAAVGTSVACVGLILSTLSMSGVGVKLITGIEQWSGGSLFLALLLVWAISVLLGMGGASITSYIIVSVFTVPALRKMGVPFEQGHFFAMFVSVFAFLTPPVAMVSLIASKMAGARYIPTAIESTKAALAGFLIPFLCVYCPILLLQPRNLAYETVELAAILLGFLCLEVAFVGYYISVCNRLERVLMAASGFCAFAFVIIQNSSILAFGLVLFLLLTMQHRSKGLRAAKEVIPA